MHLLIRKGKLLIQTHPSQHFTAWSVCPCFIALLIKLSHPFVYRVSITVYLL